MVTVTTPEIQGQHLLTNSAMACYKTCRRKFYYAYEMGWRPAQDKVYLRIGSLIHDALDMLAKGEAMQTIEENIRKLYDVSKHENGADIQAIGYECETVICLIQHYQKAWVNSRIAITDSESAFELPIINPTTGYPLQIFRQAGKRDRICTLPDGRKALMETKTVSDDIGPDSDYRHVLAINQQISMYFLASQTEGLELETILYDCIRKPTVRPCDVAVTDENGDKVVEDIEGNRVFNGNGKPRQTGDKEKGYTLKTRPMTPAEWREKLSSDIAARPDYYYQRFEIPRLQNDLDEFSYELYEIAQDINTSRKTGRWYRNTGACRNWNSLCPYYGICAKQVDTQNGIPNGFRQAETVHEELSQ